MRFTTRLAAATIAAAVLAIPAASAQTVTLRAVSAFPTPLKTNDMLRDYIARVNKAGAGKVRIVHLGGPEVIKAPDQAQAVRNGVIDILYGAANYYQGVVPEGDAIIGSTKKPWEVRANGGWKLLQEAHAKKMNTYLLGWPGASFPFYIYTRAEPKFKPDGLLDLTGLKIRTTPIYREFLKELGATPVVIQIPEVYTSLERGLVDGVGFPINTLNVLGWNKHLKYRIEPSFFMGDLVANVNLKKWNSMPQETRDLLEKMMIEQEKIAWDFYLKLDKSDDAALRKAGMKVVAQKGDAGKKFVSMSQKVVWDRLAKASPEYAAKLKTAFSE
ncbi:MAG: TRAP transporter substrate-binding protein DctP [Beijerinckiaceae bacterium]